MNRCVAALVVAAALAGCAATGGDSTISPPVTPAPSTGDRASQPIDVPTVTGTVEVDVANVLGQNLPCRVDFLDSYGSPPTRLEAPEGTATTELPIGEYRCYIHVYDQGVPVLCEIRNILINEQSSVLLLANILEGAGGRMGVHGFDSDGDLAIDRVELASGTLPSDAASIPGRARLPYNKEPLAQGAKWYRGELYAQSQFGNGTERVGDLVRRAEKAGLDFLAITDRNNMKSVRDPEYHSSSLVLIPAMEWGTDDMGYALIYGPRTEPDLPSSPAAAQAECLRVQAQGGAFMVARPCFPDAPWKWGLSYVNGMQVWFRDWRSAPPMSLEALPESLKLREDGGLVHSIAAAAAAADLDVISANVQAAKFWDYELVRGLMAAGIAGSGTGGPGVPMGAPVTYVYAEEKSLPAIMDGLRLGRTYMSSGLSGPQINFSAQVLLKGGASVGVGGAVPLDVDVRFEVGVLNAQGKKLEVLLNGRPILTKVIESNTFGTRFDQHPKSYGVYRVRVVGEPQKPGEGFGVLEVYAMTSPIYAQNIAQEILWRFPNLDPSKTWIRLEEDTTKEVDLNESLPPLEVGKPWVRPRGLPQPPPTDGPPSQPIPPGMQPPQR